MSECPCGLIRSTCEYHKDVPVKSALTKQPGIARLQDGIKKANYPDSGLRETPVRLGDIIRRQKRRAPIENVGITTLLGAPPGLQVPHWSINSNDPFGTLPVAKQMLYWIPSVVPMPGTMFYGIERHVNPTELAGHRFYAAALSPEEAFIQTDQLLTKMDGVGTHLVVPSSFILQSGWPPGTQLIGHRGYVALVEEVTLPSSAAFLLSYDSWFRFDDGAIVCMAPSMNVRISF
jgi:hypothetical protein